MKKAIYNVLSILSTALLVSCGSQGKPSTKEETPEIVVAGDYDNFEAIEAEFDRFKDANPKLDVDFSYVKIDDYDNTIGTVLDGKDKPNIFFSKASMFADDKFNSVIAHMEDLSDESLNFNLDCIRPGLLNHDENGKVSMVPIFSRTYGTLINEDLFKKENIQIPTNWSELLTTCQSFVEKGYKSPMMGYSLKSSSSLMNTVAYPLFVAELSKTPGAVDLANKLDPAAGEYMRPALEAVDNIFKEGCANLEECDKISDNYEQVLLRFFEGDVPMMVCAADTVSGRKKREAKSKAYKNNPFKYSYYSIPATAEGGYFIDSPSKQFSVNKDCDNLDLTNQFMRFLLNDVELNNVAASKGLLPVTKAMPLDSVYAPFAQIPTNRTLSPEVLGVKDPLATAIRLASFKIIKEGKTIDEVIGDYANLK